MHLLPREEARILLNSVGFLAQRRLARGLRLNLVEATALIACVLQELIRDGQHTSAQLVALGKHILGRAHVLPSVPALLHEVHVEGTLPDGVFLVACHDPIATATGDMAMALYGSLLPPPPEGTFGDGMDPVDPKEIPGALVLRTEPIVLNPGRSRVRVLVTNVGDRPIQVGSHYHFSETNKALRFDRELALFRRLDIAPGTAVRFEPGDSKTVSLVEIAGHKIVSGGNLLVNTSWQLLQGVGEREKVMRRILERGFEHREQGEVEEAKACELSRETYASMYGPTTGDLVRLGDTDLWVEVERDLTSYGDELKFGGGKVIREGMGSATGRPDAMTLDLVITNALIIDWSGIYKADIGVKNNFIVGIGKAGNPDIMAGVSENMTVGVNTEVIAAEKMIVTAGAIDSHFHYICPQLCTEALASVITSVIGGGTGPTTGTNATTCTPSATYIKSMMAATDGIALNFGFTGKGNDSAPIGLVDQVKAGVCGLKLHEDWGSGPAAVDNCLTVCDDYDIQVTLHGDTLNESGFVDSTIDAFKGRTIHAYHVEGAGGGHAPDIVVIAGHSNVLPSSTNPTRPYTINTLDEHLDMLMVCHHLDRKIPEDIAFTESRIRAETVAAEDILHDLGAISMISSDSLAVDRVGEVVSRTWRTANKLKEMRGPMPGEKEGSDNLRVKRFIAKYTINPAITHGMSHVIGDLSVGKLADLAIWSPSNFGIRPEQVIKGGVVAWAQLGEANASIPTVQPVIGRPMWGCEPKAAALNSILFVSEHSINTGTVASYGLSKRTMGVRNCRNIGKADMKLNDAMPLIEVDAETYTVKVDGEICTIAPATQVALSKQYMLF